MRNSAVKSPQVSHAILMLLYTTVIQTYAFVMIDNDLTKKSLRSSVHNVHGGQIIALCIKVHVVGTRDFPIHITRGHCDSCTNA